jgi:hypothetical protein
MNAYICDRCGKVILPAEDVRIVTFYSKGTSLDHMDHADLCSDCFQLVKKIAFGKFKTGLEGK